MTKRRPSRHISISLNKLSLHATAARAALKPFTDHQHYSYQIFYIQLSSRYWRQLNSRQKHSIYTNSNKFLGSTTPKLTIFYLARFMRPAKYILRQKITKSSRIKLSLNFCFVTNNLPKRSRSENHIAVYLKLTYGSVVCIRFRL